MLNMLRNKGVILAAAMALAAVFAIGCTEMDNNFEEMPVENEPVDNF